MEEFKATFVKANYYDQKQQFFIGTVRPYSLKNCENSTLSNIFNTECIVGTVDDGSRFVPGLTYLLFGAWCDHPQYGRQFRFDSWCQEQPLSESEVVAYLIKFATGIGEKLAKQLFAMWGSEAIVMLKLEPKKVAEQVKRLTPEMAIAISRQLKAIEGNEHLRARMMQVFAGHRVPQSTIEECLEKWGAEAPDTIRNNPYCLLDAKIRRIGFATADAMYMNFGGDAYSPERSQRLLRYLVETDRSGSTWIKQSTLRQMYNEQMREQITDFTAALATCLAEGTLVSYDEFVSSKAQEELEKRVADDVCRIVSAKEPMERSMSTHIGPQVVKVDPKERWRKHRKFKGNS